VGAEYAVNIKLNAPKIKSDLKGISTEISKLESRVAKLNRSTGKNPTNKQLLRVERDKLALQLKENRLEKRNLQTKVKELQTERSILNTRRQSTNLVPRSTGGGRATGGGGSSAGKSGGVLSSALISGSFPLLFGQGIAGGAFGALGGGIGAKFGGQMGGFAGGLVATAGLQIFNNISNSISEFGAALTDPSQNLDKLVLRIKNFDRSIVTSTSTLKNAGLDQVAGELASLTLQQRFGGLDSIKGLNKQMLKFQQATKDLATRLSILVAGPLTAFFKLLTVIAGGTNKATESITSTEAIREQQKTLELDLAKEKKISDELVKNEEKLANLKGIQMDTEAKLVGKISRGEKDLEKIRERIKGNERILDLRKIEREVLQSAQKLLVKQISLEQTRIGIVRGDLDEKALSVEQKKLDVAKATVKAKKAEANLKSLLLNKEATKAEIEIAKEKLKNLATELNLVTLIADARIRAADPMLSRIDELNREMRKLNDTERQSVELSKVMGTSFEDSFKGIIRGTMTVQDAFRNMLNKIADFFIETAAQMAANQFQKGLLGLFGNILGSGLGGSGGGKFLDSNAVPLVDPLTGIGTAADGGRIPGGRPTLVGERGPELFTPGVSGMITPNHALGGSTNVVVNVDASGSSVEGDEQQGRELGRLISVAVQSEIANQQRPGGLLFR